MSSARPAASTTTLVIPTARMSSGNRLPSAHDATIISMTTITPKQNVKDRRVSEMNQRSAMARMRQMVSVHYVLFVGFAGHALRMRHELMK